MAKQVKITLVRSKIGVIPKLRANLRGLGLAKINQSVVLEDTDCTRGMIAKVNHLVRVEEIQS